ncbi:EcsC family protein [Thiohalorhabdus methylotrophus]|uniref:EcsC family protein n=1 Tax=Thiohalorhabdus methylotrophus TaxID=3242694 RepID=A0ABV4TUM5_9GAMM
MVQLPVVRLASEDWRALQRAHFFLEHPSLAARLTSVVGSPMEQAFALLPRRGYVRLQKASRQAVSRAMETAVYTLGTPARMGTGSQARSQRLLGVGTGAAGGFFGLPGLLAELPVTTVLMLRAIATVAQSQGEDLSDPEARLACIQVFALGGRSRDDDSAEMGYFGVRAALAYHFSPVSYHLARQGLTAMDLPVSVRFVSAIAGRFGVPVSEKAAFQMVPLMGAATGALINTIFFHHFQNMAWGHFTVRRLERRYGTERVQRWYRRIPDEAGATENLGP